jgi:hypothetical protein
VLEPWRFSAVVVIRFSRADRTISRRAIFDATTQVSAPPSIAPRELPALAGSIARAPVFPRAEATSDAARVVAKYHAARSRRG